MRINDELFESITDIFYQIHLENLSKEIELSILAKYEVYGDQYMREPLEKAIKSIFESNNSSNTENTAKYLQKIISINNSMSLH